MPSNYYAHRWEGREISAQIRLCLVVFNGVVLVFLRRNLLTVLDLYLDPACVLQTES
jgi:hypothetical protein